MAIVTTLIFDTWVVLTPSIDFDASYFGIPFNDVRIELQNKKSDLYMNVRFFVGEKRLGGYLRVQAPTVDENNFEIDEGMADYIIKEIRLNLDPKLDAPTLIPVDDFPKY